MKKKILYIILIVSLSSIGVIRCFGQIILTDKAFDFYGDAVINVGILKKDTALLNIKIKQKDTIINKQELQIAELTFAEATEKGKAKNYKDDLGTCGTKLDKKSKWNKIYKKVILTVTSVVILEGLLIYTLIKP